MLESQKKYNRGSTIHRYYLTSTNSIITNKNQFPPVCKIENQCSLLLYIIKVM